MKLPWKLGLILVGGTILVNIISILKQGTLTRGKFLLKARENHEYEDVKILTHDSFFFKARDYLRKNKDEDVKICNITRRRKYKSKKNIDYDQAFYRREEKLVRSIIQNITTFEAKCSHILKGMGTDPGRPLWQKKLRLCNYKEKKHFNLVVALQVRIYSRDKAKWTLAELKQWMHYVFWMGAEHIYLCDHYKFKSERLKVHLERYIKAGLLTYIPWNQRREAMEAQVACYQHLIDKYSNNSLWQVAIDMDEYPFLLGDQKEGFMNRYLKTMNCSVSEVSFHNYLMLGQGDRLKNMTIERITRMTPKRANGLDKPFYRPTRVIANLHHNVLRRGERVEAQGNVGRLVHYWGSRWNQFKPDTPKLYNITIEYPLVKTTLAGVIRQSLLSFGEIHAFNSTTGP